MNDWELIQRWTKHQDQAAFATLVGRYLAFVHGCARRQLGATLAQDATQAVFLILARKAPTFRSDLILSSWLFRTTGFVVAQLRRQEARRRDIESEAATMLTPFQENSPDEARHRLLESHLDAALASLSESDRRFVLTRFFERQRFTEVALRLGVSEDAAKKRVSRAVERLRDFFERRGIAVSSARLGAWLLEPRSEALPPSFDQAIGQSIAQLANRSSAPSSQAIQELANNALRHASHETLRIAAIQGLAWVAGIALIVALSQAIVQQFSSGPMPPEIAEPMAQNVPTIGPMASTPTTSANSRSLALTLVDANTEAPLGAVEIHASLRYGLAEHRNWSSATDSDGATQLELGNRPFEKLLVRVAKPGYVTTDLTWGGFEFENETPTYVCRLRRGTKLSGEVLTLSGQPVPNATVSVRSESGYEDGGRESVFLSLDLTTDSQGRFFTDSIQAPRESFQRKDAGRQLAISVIHPEFAIGNVVLMDAESLESHLVLYLRRGGLFTGRVLDPSGVPIIGAVIHGNWGTDPNRQADSGTLGEFRLPHVGAGDALKRTPNEVPIHFQFQVRAPGYRSQSCSLVHVGDEVRLFNQSAQAPTSKATLLTSSSGAPDGFGYDFHVESDLVLEPNDGQTDPSDEPRPRPTGPVRLRGTVVDDTTGTSIAEFRLASKLPGNGFRNFLGAGRNGSFDWTLPSTADLALNPPQQVFAQNAFSWNAPNSHTFSIGLEAAADGYLPCEAQVAVENGSSTDIVFRLRNSAQVSGWIELPNTRPAVGALIGMGGDGTRFLKDDQGHLRWQNDSTFSSLAGAEGRFQLQHSPRADRLQILHPEGCAIFALPATPDTIIRLEPWSDVEIRAWMGEGVAAAGATIRLQPESPSNRGRPYGFDFLYQSRTDEQGHTHFTQVPPGRLVAELLDAQDQVIATAKFRTVRGRSVPVQLTPPSQASSTSLP